MRRDLLAVTESYFSRVHHACTYHDAQLTLVPEPNRPIVPSLLEKGLVSQKFAPAARVLEEHLADLYYGPLQASGRRTILEGAQWKRLYEQRAADAPPTLQV
jgi:hypothetical protein